MSVIRGLPSLSSAASRSTPSCPRGPNGTSPSSPRPPERTVRRHGVFDETSKSDAGSVLDRPRAGWSTESPVDTSLKRTPLFSAHVKAGARMVPFGGWEMPVQYRGIVEEHRTVRAAVGCFDVSHMGEFEIEGPGALATLQTLTTNDVAALEIGQVQYSLLCRPDGGIVDDLTLYRLATDRFMLTVNAGMRWEYEAPIAESDKVAIRVIMHGTHQGEFFGIPTNGKLVTVSGIHMLRIANGKLVEHWGNNDDLGLLQQLGVVPPPGQAS